MRRDLGILICMPQIGTKHDKFPILAAKMGALYFDWPLAVKGTSGLLFLSKQKNYEEEPGVIVLGAKTGAKCPVLDVQISIFSQLHNGWFAALVFGAISGSCIVSLKLLAHTSVDVVSLQAGESVNARANLYACGLFRLQVHLSLGDQGCWGRLLNMLHVTA